MKTDFKSAAKFFEKASVSLYDTIVKATKAGFYVFIGKAVKKYYSGRPGVNRVSGRLANSWMVDSTDKTVYAYTDTKYAHVHEHEHGFTGWIQPKAAKVLRFVSGDSVFYSKKVFIPQRTHVVDLFKDEGMQTITKSIDDKIDSVIKSLKI